MTAPRGRVEHGQMVPISERNELIHESNKCKEINEFMPESQGLPLFCVLSYTPWKDYLKEVYSVGFSVELK